MPPNEMRKDYVLDRWVVIAAERGRRPKDFVQERQERRPSSCPLCPGNEHLTPPAALVYLKTNGKMVKEKDQDGFRHKNWLVRCMPNLYPAFAPHADTAPEASKPGYFESLPAVGHHEVLIESPNHDEHPSVARVAQLVHVLNAYVDRFKTLSAESHVRYVSIFRNHGASAGASLSHAHTQIIATPILPTTLEEEVDRSAEFRNESGRCVFCDIIEKERGSPRFIWQNESFLVFAPWASVHPFEFWLFPKRHQPTIMDLEPGEIMELAVALRVCFGGLRRLLQDPDYNFGFHMTPAEHYHWHLEVYPRLATWAGFEKSTGIFINVTSPETAASELRVAAQKEEEELA